MITSTQRFELDYMTQGLATIKPFGDLSVGVIVTVIIIIEPILNAKGSDFSDKFWARVCFGTREGSVIEIRI